MATMRNMPDPVSVTLRDYAPTPHEKVKLFYIDTRSVKIKDVLTPIGKYTRQGQQLLEKTGEEAVPIQFPIRGRLYIAPPIGGFIEIDEHLVDDFINSTKRWDKNLNNGQGGHIYAFTTDESVAKMVKARVDAGETDVLFTSEDLTKSALTLMSDAELEAELEKRAAAKVAPKRGKAAKSLPVEQSENEVIEENK